MADLIKTTPILICKAALLVLGDHLGFTPGPQYRLPRKDETFDYRDAVVCAQIPLDEAMSCRELRFTFIEPIIDRLMGKLWEREDFWDMELVAGPQIKLSDKVGDCGLTCTDPQSGLSMALGWDPAGIFPNNVSFHFPYALDPAPARAAARQRNIQTLLERDLIEAA